MEKRGSLALAEAPSATGTTFWESRRVRDRIANGVGYVFLTIITVIVLIPLVWTVSSSLKTVPELYAFPPTFMPETPQWQNYPDAWNRLPFARFFANTMLLAILNIVGKLVSVSLVAYGFARLRFTGRNMMFMLLLSVMMLPHHVTLIPTYILYRQLGMVGTYWPLFLPSFFGGAPFLIFLTRQYLMTLPKDLDEAAAVDGANRLQILFHVLLPLLKPPLTIVVVFTFLDVWNDYLGPLIYLNDREMYTLALGLTFFQTRIGNLLNYLMAMSVAMLILPMIVYFLAQRHIIGGIASVGIKG